MVKPTVKNLLDSNDVIATKLRQEMLILRKMAIEAKTSGPNFAHLADELMEHILKATEGL